MAMRVGLLALLVGVSSMGLGGCVVYEPVAVAPSPSTYDRAYSAALGGMPEIQEWRWAGNGKNGKRSRRDTAADF